MSPRVAWCSPQLQCLDVYCWSWLQLYEVPEHFVWKRSDDWMNRQPKNSRIIAILARNLRSEIMQIETLTVSDALRGCSYEADSWTYRPIVPTGAEQLIATTPVIYMQQVQINEWNLNLVSVMSWGLGSRGKGGCFQLFNSTFYRLLAEVLFFRRAESLRLETTRPSPLLGGL